MGQANCILLQAPDGGRTVKFTSGSEAEATARASGWSEPGQVKGEPEPQATVSAPSIDFPDWVSQQVKAAIVSAEYQTLEEIAESDEVSVAERLNIPYFGPKRASELILRLREHLLIGGEE